MTILSPLKINVDVFRVQS